MQAKVDTHYWRFCAYIGPLFMPLFFNGAFARSGILHFRIEFLIWMVCLPTLTYFVLKSIPRVENENAG
jgi:hypothetical protein